MFEKTNQTEENSALVNEEGINAEAFIEGAIGDEAQNGADAEPSKPEEEMYTVKYNGKEVSLTMDELKTNAQKGMNYDHIKGELDALKNSQQMKPGELSEDERAERARDFIAKEHGISAQFRQNINEFSKNFPDLKAADIPTEVMEIMKERGMSLSMAYLTKANNDLKNQVKAYEQNEKNTKTAVGSVLSEGTARQSDPFLAGMMGY